MTVLDHSESIWQAPPSEPVLAAEEVHLWLYQSASCNQADWALLSMPERQRAERMGRAASRTQYVGAQSALRRTLARYLDTDPKAITLQRRAGGKPELAPGHGASVRFNLSHSAHLTLIGISRSSEIGVDVEMQRTVNALTLARRFFCAPEAEWLEQQDEVNRQQQFFALWTAKEALAKAMGQGIAGNLRRYCVRIDDGRAIWQDRQHTISPQDWQLHLLPATDSYSAAMAVESSAQSLRCFAVA